ncbi:MAG: pilF [Francisellaceae bacterium]|nr:pilF [Francisellaceae bacterium]
MRKTIPVWLICGLVVGLSSCQMSNKASSTNLNAGQLHSLKGPQLEKAAQINIELGLNYLEQGEMARAKSKFMHALELSPHSPEVHSALAFFLERIGDIKEAQLHHLKALKYARVNGMVYNNYGAFLCRQNRTKEADAAFQKSLHDKTYPRTAEVLENAGLCALKIPDYKKAEHYLLTAIQQDPLRAKAMIALSDLFISKGQYDKASHYYASFQKISKPTPHSLLVGIRLNQALNNNLEVRNLELMLKNLYPDSKEYQSSINQSVAPK